MWLIARLLIAFGALVYRLYFRRTPKSYDCRHGDLRYSEDAVTKKKRAYKRYYETPVESAFICVLSKETTFDRFFKTIGFGEELQTSDPAFDRLVYVLGDHPLTQAYLTSKPAARATILKLISAGAMSISITGESLRLEVPDPFDYPTVLDDLATLARELRAVQSDVRSRFADPYYDTALVVQSVVLSVIVYGVVGFLETFANKPGYHINPEPVIQLSLVVTGVFLSASVVAVWLLLRRSSLGPRLITENCVLFLLLPFSGFEAVSDVNRMLDSSPGWIVSYRVDDLEKVYHKGRKGASYYSYHARISALSPSISYPVAVPPRLEINYGLYKALSQTKQLSMEIGEGSLGFPWYRDMWAGPPQP